MCPDVAAELSTLATQIIVFGGNSQKVSLLKLIGRFAGSSMSNGLYTGLEVSVPAFCTKMEMSTLVVLSNHIILEFFSVMPSKTAVAAEVAPFISAAVFLKKREEIPFSDVNKMDI
jgi:hypothetical protein